MKFQEIVTNALVKARAKHAPMHSAHEAYAVILEEMDEVKAEVWKQELDKDKLLKELSHVGAMVQRAAEDLSLVES